MHCNGYCYLWQSDSGSKEVGIFAQTNYNSQLKWLMIKHLQAMDLCRSVRSTFVSLIKLVF